MTKSRVLTFCSLAIVINIVLGTIVSMLKIPLLFMDTVGTIFSAVLFGPMYGAIVGVLSNVLTSLLTGNISSWPFAIVSLVVGVVVGYISKKKGFSIKTAVITGLILSIVAPLIGTPISVFMFGGLAGGGADLLVAGLLASGQQIFAASFITRISSNLVDKIVSCVAVYFLIKRMKLTAPIKIKQ